MGISISEGFRPEAGPPAPPPGVCKKCKGRVNPVFLPGGRIIAPRWVTPDLCPGCVEKAGQRHRAQELAERKLDLVKLSNLPAEALNWSFDRAQAEAKGLKSDPTDLKSWQRAQLACRYWPGGRQGLYLYGEAGTGKTVLAWCLLNWALARTEPLTCFFLPVSELFDEVGIGFGVDSRARYLAAKAKKARFLVLDDIGAVRPRRKMAEVLFDIVDSRVSAHTPTIYTSNFGPGELDKRLRDQFGRVIDRIVGSTQGVPVMGRSFRVLGAEHRWR